MKVMLCQNEKICIAVVGSANMNRNIRHEAGIITTDLELFHFYDAYFDKVFTEDSIPFAL